MTTPPPPKELHIFDLDHTLIQANSSHLFGHYLYNQNYFPISHLLLGLSYYFRHKVFGLSLKQLHHKSFDLFFTQRPIHALRNLVRHFLDLNLNSLLNPEVLERLQNAQASGHATVLMSNSPDFIVQPIAERLLFTDFRASQYQVDKTGRLCHISSVLCGQDKAKEALLIAHEMGLSSNSLTAYSDSYLDLPLLKAVGIPIAVNPDHKLKKACKDLQWKVLTNK
ncbi:hypothetical protein SCG7109_AS_00020 [Chlamydiales bacterium SCGC AG-110-M15]|nr:hypothetical protein SCG7109_AS_00020 [Chlamydiales bacterium SCGC AG-110-M15]